MGGPLHQLPGTAPPTTAPADAAKRSASPGAPPELVLLRAGLGNRGFGQYARTLARRDKDDEKSVTVYLAGPPRPVHAAERATAENAELAKWIDELDKLDKAALLKRREDEAALSVQDGGSRDHDLAFQAAEFIAQRRRYAPMKNSAYYPDHPSRSPIAMRMIVQVMIEQGISETGSFKKAMDRLPDNDVIAPFAKFWESERNAFAHEFKRQAYITVRRMLDGSDQAIDKVLTSYGIPVGAARGAAYRYSRGGDLDDEAAGVVRQATLAADVDDPKKVKHRQQLAVRTHELKDLQANVKAAHEKLNKADMNRPADRSDPRWKVAYDAHVELAAAQRELQSLWIATERLNPVLAAVRRDGDIEKADLGKLDSTDVQTEMTAVVKELLPKIGDIQKAKDRIFRSDADTSPLAIPTVVALTRANMFIPKGSIRDGIAADLVSQATGADSWLSAIGAVALVLVSLLPGGMVIAGIAGTAIAAFGAVDEYDEYRKQKTFANTDMDMARSLATSDPSLTSFAMSLVGLGFEVVMLAQAFAEVRRLKQLITAGEDTAPAVNELNKIGATKGKGDLGKTIETDLRTQERAGAGATTDAGETGAGRTAPKDEPKPNEKPKTRSDETPKGPPKDPPSGGSGGGGAGGGAPKTTSMKARALGFTGKADVKAKLHAAVGALETGMDKLPKEYVKMLAALEKAGPEFDELRRLTHEAMSAMRDPEALEQLFAEAWARGIADDTGINAALLKIASDEGLTVKVIRADAKEMSGPVFFDRYGGKPVSVLDKALADPEKLHTSMMHIVQDILVNRRMKTLGLTSGHYRSLLGKANKMVRWPWSVAQGEAKMIKWGDYIWRVTYDLQGGRGMNTPEALGPILMKLFKMR